MRALLDTSYFLPVFGIAVMGLEPESLLELRRLALRGAVELYYADFMWLELIPKVVREASKRGVDASRIVEEGVRLITGSSYLRPVSPGRRAVLEALRLRLMGHRDMVDNLLYGVAVEEDMLLVTMDSALRRLVESLDPPGARVLSHVELLGLLGGGAR